MRKLFAIIFAAIAFVGCSMDDITVSYQTDKSDIYYASFEDFGEESRTYVDENVKLLWHEDDRISLFRTTLNEQYKFTGATGDNSGGFSAIPSDEWVTGNVVSTNYAVYPYDATTKLSNDEIIQLTMPAVQQYAENSFGRGANTMVAASESTSSKFLPFRNLGGYIIVKLYGENTTIKSIEFKGNNDEVIAGAATAEAKYGYLPVVTMSESGTTTITLDCGEEGVTISSDSANPTSFWFVVPPITFEGGFTFTITDINGNTFTKSTTKSQTVVRNEVKSMSGFEPTFEGEGEDPEVAPKPANNEIWYTNGSTTEATTPYKTDVFGANIVSNTYDADKKCWVIKFDGDVTTVGNSVFYGYGNNCNNITSILLPNCVTSIGGNAFCGCFSLTSVTIPESVTEINERAFFNSGLLNVTIPDNVTTIGASAFSACNNLTSVIIGENVESIGNEAFYSCMNLSSVYCKASVPPTLGEYVFYYWNSDKEKEWSLGCVKYVPDDSLTLYKSTSGWGSSYGYNYDVISTITYTTSDFEVIVADLPIVSNTYNNDVGELIFYGDLGSLSSNVFYKNVNLASFGGAYASADGRSLIVDGILFAIAPYGLSEYSIPSGVHTIIANAFSGCNQLSSITIPQSVTDIKNNAFHNCNALSSIICYATTPPTIAEGVFTCDSATFYINVPQDYIADYIADPYWSIYESYILAISDRSKYKIGDLASYNGSEGVVFFVSETVVMLLSTDRTTSNWGLYGTKIGAEDSYNGRNNVIVAKEKGYFDSLPHFVWCENYGDGWYLPASGELKLVRSVYSTISETMTNNGFEGIDGYYCSSTEYGNFDALIVSLTSESTGTVSKNDIYNVRAITAF